MKVQNALANMNDVILGYIRMIPYVEGGEAEEKGLETFTNKELVDVLQKDCVAYYRIGSYYYVIYRT